MKKKITKKEADFDLHAHYIQSVQAPDVDARFFRKTYRELRQGKEPRVLREDFCGSFSVCCEWIKLHADNRAIGVDLDPDPLNYGHKYHATQLKPAQRERLEVFQKNVLEPGLPSADVVVACNFSYFLLTERTLLKRYFEQVVRSLNKNGIFILDSFGGPFWQIPNEEKRKFKGYKYFFSLKNYDPISNMGHFQIEFLRDGEKRRRTFDTYHFRMWGMREIRELLIECGFQKTYVYWEGTDKNGTGNGNFRPREKGDECQAWIAYIVAEK